MNTRNIRQTNKQKIIDAMKGKESCNKAEIASITGLSLASVNTLIEDLLKEGQITVLGYNDSTGGRRSKAYQLLATYTKVLCFSIFREGFKVTIVYHIYDLHDQLIEERKLIKKRAGLEDVRSIIDAILLVHENIKVISFSTPGIIEQGYLSCTGIEGFNNLHLEELIKHYDQEFAFVNDVNSAALGFARMYPQYNTISFLFMPESLFAGIGSVIDGKLLIGKSNIAGEAQYLPYNGEKTRQELMISSAGAQELSAYYCRVIISMINPDAIAVCCSMYEDCQPVKDMLLSTFQEYDLPDLIRIDKIFHCIMLGTLELAKRKLKETE